MVFIMQVTSIIFVNFMFLILRFFDFHVIYL